MLCQDQGTEHACQIHQVETRVQDGRDARSVRAGCLQGGTEHAVRAAALAIHGRLAHSPPGLPLREQLGHILHCAERTQVRPCMWQSLDYSCASASS